MIIRILAVLSACFMLLLAGSKTLSADVGDNNEQSITHFRAFYPPLLGSNVETLFVNDIKQDSDGFLWLRSDAHTFFKYDGYALERFIIQPDATYGEHVTNTLFYDSEGQTWLGNSRLSIVSKQLSPLESFDITNGKAIYSIVDDNQGNLWLFGRDFGFVKFNKGTKQVEGNFASDEFENVPGLIVHAVLDPKDATIWMHANDGIYKFDIEQGQFSKVLTPIDEEYINFFPRNLSIDHEERELWVSTTRGLIKIDIDSSFSTLYTVENTGARLPSNYATSTRIDAKGNVWIGFEKNGLCKYLRDLDGFSCLPADDDKDNAIPASTVENIFEDKSGSLWLAMNNSGFVRISPNIEKFTSLNHQILTKGDALFKRAVAAISVSPNANDNDNDNDNNNDKELWIATDGNGIQIVNARTRELSQIRHQPNNPNSLPSDAVVTITQGPNGFIWAGTWEGGLSKIDPNTRQIENIGVNNTDDETKKLLSNSVVEIVFDESDNLWISAWFIGIQKYDPVNATFENFIAQANDSRLKNRTLNDLKYLNGNIWLIGTQGLERFSTESGQGEIVFRPENCPCESLFISADQTIYIGATNGFYRYDLNTKSAQFEALGDDNNLSVYYFLEDENGLIWIASNIGIFRFNPDGKETLFYNELDGLANNIFTRFGEGLMVQNKLYFPGRNDISIISPDDLPEYDSSIKTFITEIKTINDADPSALLTALKQAAPSSKSVAEIPYALNSLAFSFSTHNLIFPNENKFKYRLLGLSDQFEYGRALDRNARFTNLPEGEYRFEVYSANSKGIWDATGASFSFTILPPWHRTWWAYLCFTAFVILLIFTYAKARVRFLQQKQAELTRIVKEKTAQITQYAAELQSASEKLEESNKHLEERVEQRTKDLLIEINERKVVESKLYDLAFHDSLTGLPNREWLSKRLDSLIKREPRNSFGLMFLDGDRFKVINDTFGHTVGDEILIVSSLRLGKLLDKHSHAIRLGGDEFTVLVENCNSIESLSNLAAQIVDAFKEPFIIEKTTISLNMSIGVVLCDDYYKNKTMALRDADIAMYEAKKAGKCTFKLFDSAMRQESSDLLEIESELRTALQNDEFHLVFQPILDLKTNKVDYFEALLRWNHPEKGFIPPDRFIPVAEETGLIIPIGAWVLEESIKTLANWHDALNSSDIGISVNLSSVQFQDLKLLEHIDSTLERYNLSPRKLKLELTESSLIENNDRISGLLDDIVSRGIELSLDDFGTGYSSLSYLPQLPAKHLKIDRKFIDALDNSGEGRLDDEAFEIVKAAITLGQSIKMHVTAEGIETSAQLDILKQLGCDFIQGYLISKPLVEEHALAFISKPVVHNKEVKISSRLERFRALQKKILTRKRRKRKS
ncbi:EAL domain-containing protein [Glaciecola sp. MH2013]|uniref:EAL domain-containing protein n=1 Tax=Glaciecola sp. MH2013 TaxID=2785524 RepID=UPI00189E3307|nr:EAL domain-containing protein [Glaciecola sp. MH2013]MBF7074371.1 EAL domain-containing protein [Glaciecola sp. MH2013]